MFPVIALVIALFSLVTMTYFNFSRDDLTASYSLWYFGYVAAAFAYYFLFIRGRLTEEDMAHFRRIE